MVNEIKNLQQLVEQNDAVAQFYINNGDFNILTHDFHDDKMNDCLNCSDQDLEEIKAQLKPMQRLLRITPDADVAQKLSDRGIDSAHKIAAMAPHQFVRDYADAFDGNEEKAKEAHTQALHMKTAVLHLYGNVKDAIASPYYRASNFKADTQDVTLYYSSIPSYQDLFGNLDYMECDPCQSIFSASAYFCDVMRIIDQYITDPNTVPARTIPTGYTLEERRPDLFNLPLTCANTTTEIPYIQVVNRVLESQIKSQSTVQDAYQTLAVSTYPIYLPYNKPLSEIRNCLKKCDSSLLNIFTDFLNETGGASSVKTLDVGREALGLSVAQYQYVSTATDSDSILSEAYGYNIQTQPPSFAGSGILGFQKDQKKALGIGTKFTSELKVSDKIMADEQAKEITAITSDTVMEVKENFAQTVGSSYMVVPTGGDTPPPFQGAGTVGFTIDSAKVTGTGTKFTSEAKVGSQIIAAGQTRTIVSIGSDTSLTVDGNWPLITSGTNYTIKPMSGGAKPPFQGEGTVSFTIDSKVTTGASTDFTTEAKVGDDVVAAGQTRTIVSIESTTSLTVDQDWPLITAGAKYTIKPKGSVVEDPYAGKGIVLYANGSKDVVGQGTTFTTDFSVGDQIQVGQSIKKVATVASNTAMTVETNWASVSGTPFVVTPQVKQGSLSTYLPGAGSGKIAVTKDQTAVTGVSTKFTTALNVDDQIFVGTQARTVLEIISDTSVNVSYAWDTTVTSSNYEILFGDGLDVVDVFIARTSLTRDQLEDLFGQNLSTQELSAGVADTLFINNTEETLHYLQTYATADPVNPVQRIKGLSLKRLDRLSRFIRLQNISAVAFADLNWAMVASGQSEITSDLIINLADIIGLTTKLNLSVPQVTAQWYDIKTMGQKSSSARQDLFDTIYNNPVLLDGESPYSQGSTVPFDPSRNPVQPWIIKTMTGDDSVIRSRLKAALMQNDDDLTTLANYVLALSGKSGNPTFDLSLDNLSWLYRLSFTASLLDITIDEYLSLLKIIFYPDGNDLLPAQGALTATVDTFASIVFTSQWIKDSGFNIYQIEYIYNGYASPYFEASYRVEDIQPFLFNLSQTAEATYLSATMLRINDLNDDQAAQLFQVLVDNNVVNATGLFKKYAVTYADVCVALPLQSVSDHWIVGFDADYFSRVIPSINAAESSQVYQALKTSQPAILVDLTATTASLSKSYEQSTNLDFLKTVFTGNDAELQVERIKKSLLTTRDNIYAVKALLNRSEEGQMSLLNNGLADFLKSTATLTGVLLPFAASESQLSDYLIAFLKPRNEGDAPSAQLKSTIQMIAQWQQIADVLNLSADDVVYITQTANAFHFNITDLTKITVGNLEALDSYKKLQNRYYLKNQTLRYYFSTARTTSCHNDKINLLSQLTGWPSDQICILITYFWPAMTPSSEDYDTVAGLLRMQSCFATGAILSADMTKLLMFADLSHLCVRKSNGDIDTAAWSTYSAAASDALGLLSVKFKDSLFTKAYGDVSAVVNTNSRDGLLGYCLWLMHSKNASITTSSDLYQYLLIDVDMSSCFTTSLIAQGISTIQLYMQRCRMMQEVGVLHVLVPKIWWAWMSNDRVWEVNRKIFLYPENYIEPTLRNSMTPEFKKLSEDLLQTDLSKTSVINPFEDYFNQVNVLGELKHVSSHHCTRVDDVTGEGKDTLYLFARTRTQPYTYYFRTLDEGDDWGPFYEIKLSIAAASVSPVYAFGRIFIFWAEFDVGKSTTIKDQQSNTETVNKVTLKYSFYRSGTWVTPQIFQENDVINAFPYNYQSMINDFMEGLLDSDNLFWHQPYVISTGLGIVGSGDVSLTKGLGIVSGLSTQFMREVRAGDTITCMGEKRVVAYVQNDNTLVVTEPWSTTTAKAQYKILPYNKSDRFEPFGGEGTVIVTKDLQVVTGNGTKFTNQFVYGDKITIDDESHLIITIQSDTTILVESPWKNTFTNSDYTVIPRRSGNEQIMILFGAALTSSYDGPMDHLPAYSNPTKDTFMKQRHDFNKSVYDSLRVAENASPTVQNIPGYATVGTSALIDSNFVKTDTRLLIADYKYTSTDNPQPQSAELNRVQAQLNVRMGENNLANNYWGNNEPGFTNSFVQPTGDGSHVNLLSYVSEEKSSLTNVSNQPGWFIFNNSDEAFLITPEDVKINKLSDVFYMSPMPMAPDMLNNMLVSTGSYTTNAKPLNQVKYLFRRLTTDVMPVLSQRLFAGGIDNLLTIESQELPELPFSRFYPTPSNTAPANVTPPISENMDFDGAFGIYFWEIFFHAPFLVADRLNSNSKFEDTMSWLQYIFNPMEPANEGEDPSSLERFWRFLPFRSMTNESLVDTLTNSKQIKRYNYDPFDPDAIASHRHVAYAKTIVMRYVDNILDCADNLYSQDTRETITQATNLYVMAANMLGKRPESKGKLPTPAPQSFNQIKASYPKDGIPQFLIELENSAAVNWSNEGVRYDAMPINDIHAYFCVPENADFTKYWDRVEDRLYKIRHCMNIQGIVRSLSLFSPPIDPRAFIRAMASGGMSAALSSQFAPPIPYFKYAYLLDKAKAMADQVAALGAALLSALEKKDAETMNLLRMNQEKTIISLTSKVKQLELEEAQSMQTSLGESLGSATYRQQHYADLIKNGLSDNEKKGLSSMKQAMIFNAVSSATKTAASIGYAVPQVGSPFAMTYGGKQIGAALYAASGVFEILAAIQSYNSQEAMNNAGWDRRASDWALQEKLASFDMAQITAQLNANSLRQQIAQQSIVIHDESIKQNQDNIDYLKSKFTNEELYQWMIGRISTLYFQSYNLAYEMALKAQRSYQYEYNTDQSYLDYGYWDDLHKGLLAADSLSLALNQMDTAAVNGGYRYLEIDRVVSLADLNPLALLTLKETGECLFELDEKLFDYDFPGHYQRQIKTISISIPAVVGPYQNIKATLTQLNNQVVMTSDAEGVNAVDFLLGGDSATTPSSDVLRSNWWVYQQIALSSGVNANGLFELNFNDSRFLPFEGTGAVSAWRLSMPKGTNRIDFNSISDVIVNVKYTAMDGGRVFRDAVTSLGALKPYGASEYLSCEQQYASRWYQFLHAPTSLQTQSFKFQIQDFTPRHVSSAKLTGFYFRLEADSSAAGTYITFDLGGIAVNLDSDNVFTYNFEEQGKQQPDLSKLFDGERTISFDLSATPPALKDKEGKYLDPQKIKNIELICYYSGSIDL